MYGQDDSFTGWQLHWMTVSLDEDFYGGRTGPLEKLYLFIYFLFIYFFIFLFFFIIFFGFFLFIFLFFFIFYLFFIFFIKF